MLCAQALLPQLGLHKALLLSCIATHAQQRLQLLRLCVWRKNETAISWLLQACKVITDVMAVCSLPRLLANNASMESAVMGRISSSKRKCRWQSAQWLASCARL